MAFNSQGGADAIGAVREAIQMYLGLQNDKFQRDRQTEADSRAGRQLAINEQQAQLEREQNEQMQQERDRRQIEFMVQQFGGQRADPVDAARARRVGAGSALEPEMTLPGRTPIQGMMAPPDISQEGPQAVAQGPQMGGGAITQAETGSDLWRMPESEKARIAAYNAQARASQQAALETQRQGGRMELERMRDATRRTAIRNTMNNSQAMAAAMRYGVDVRDATARAQLEQRIIDSTWNMGDDEFNNMMQGGIIPLMLRMQQQGGQLPQPPRAPAPQYFAPTGGSDWSLK